MKGEIRSPDEMWPDDLAVASVTQALARLGQGSAQWLRHAAKTGVHAHPDPRLAIGAQAELDRRTRLESE